ncbi:class 1 isoprenoid biosynthesis enzyme [Micromonospora sp. BQ11]|uniref:class 1 isoprenoid biosynthesis enzyme n=1 Tax=Micromonospora sp. BQ11 TaxID=3452212 RepID=UPI003F8C8AC2
MPQAQPGPPAGIVAVLDPEQRLEQALADVHAELGALTRRLATSSAAVDLAMAEFIERVIGRLVAGGSPALDGIARLPLLVAGAESGEPGRGGTASIIHLLWWAAARYLDDLADAAPDRSAAPATDGTTDDAGILTAMATGTQLPARLIDAAPVDDAVRVRMINELTRCWLDGINGQLLDYANHPATTTIDVVLRSYAGKTGAPYGMAAALGALLAGADDHRVDQWRRVGSRLGVLRQLANDRRDLTTGRDEDLRNGTATYLLAHLLDPLPDQQRRELLALHAAAAGSDLRRADFKRHLLAPAVLVGYAGEVDRIAHLILQDIDGLGGGQPYAADLHHLVDQAVTLFPLR